MANVMNALAKSAQPAARAALAEVRDAEDRERALKALALFKKDYEATWPKAVEKVTKDIGALLAFFDFPAEHWVHLKTTNPIESTFATVRSAHQGYQGTGLAGRWTGHGLQADRVGPDPLAGRQRPTPRRTRAGGRRLREGGDGRAIGGG